jgi:flavodoxin
MSRTLVVYYSLQGHTKKVAESIAESRKADIYRIELKRNYNVATALTLGRVHINKKHAPAIKSMNLDIDSYDEIIIGTPVWWYTFAPPIRSFIEEFDISGKRVRFFSTHQGANGSTFKDLTDLVGNVTVLSANDYHAGSFNDEKVQGDFIE